MRESLQMFSSANMENVPRDSVNPEDAMTRVGMLENSFKQFAEASQKLETKYQQLLAETDTLRQRLHEKDLEIKRAERLSLLGETAAAIAHEVRNPLGAIKLFTSLLRRDLKDRPSSLELVEQIDRSAVNLDAVVANILQFAKGQSPQSAPLNVHSVLQEQITHLLPKQTRDGVPAREVQVLSDLRANPFICGNEHGLRQVFHNLILNAIQAMRGKGTLHISSDNDPNGGIRLVLRDSGPGVDAQLLGKIFEPFVTTKNEGTGLGLAVVQQIIQNHGGSVSVKNVPGAEFTICIPRGQVGKK